MFFTLAKFECFLKKLERARYDFEHIHRKDKLCDEEVKALYDFIDAI